MEQKDTLAWRRSDNFEAVAAEFEGVRKRVGLGDFSAFAKFEIVGEGATPFLDRICANRLPRQIGGIVLSHLLNEAGTIEGEIVLVKLGDEHYYCVTGAPSERRVWQWLNENKRSRDGLEIVNRTREIGIVILAGPRSRAVLEVAAGGNLSGKFCPWLNARRMSIADVPVRALRMSFTGEPAWELHCANEHLGTVWQHLWNIGKDYDMTAFGSLALNSLRMEKAYRSGGEISNDVSPLEVDMMRFVDLEKTFIGHDALRERVDRGPTTQIAYLSIDSKDADCLGSEAVYKDDELVGTVSSGAYGHGCRKSLAFAFLTPSVIKKGNVLHVSLLGERRRAKVLVEAIHDPRNKRLRD